MRRLIMRTIVVGLSSTGTVAGATDFSWAPFASVYTRANDNVRGVSDRATANPEAVWGFDTGGGVKLRAQNPNLLSELTPRFNIRRFVIGDNIDADEYSVASNNDWIAERYGLGMDVSYSRDSTLSTLVDDFGALRNDIVDRDSISVTPSASWFIDDRTALQTSFLFNDVAYLAAQQSQYVDYRYLQGTASINHQWRDNLALFGTFFASDFLAADDENPLNGNQESSTRSYGGQAGATWQWDQSLEVTGAIGWISSAIDFFDQRLALVLAPLPQIIVVDSPTEAAGSGPIAQVNIRKAFETITATFDYSRQVSPSGRGSQSKSDRIALNLRKRCSSHLTVLFDGQYHLQTAEREVFLAQARSLNRDYAEVRGTLRYRFSREWSMSASYRFGHRASTNLNSADTANAHAIFVGIDFNGLPETFLTGF